MFPKIHHSSFLTQDITQAFTFFHEVLGLKLLMKTVDQDDSAAYQLFFSDDKGRPGSQIAILQTKEKTPQTFGTNHIERLLLKVPHISALSFWEKRLEGKGFLTYGSETFQQRPILRFDGPNHMQIGLVPLRDFEKTRDFHPFKTSEIPEEFAILGIDALQFRTQYAQATILELNRLFSWKKQQMTSFFTTNQEVTVLANHNPHFYQEIHVIQDRKAPLAQLGIGGISQIAFSVADEEALFLKFKILEERSFHHSGILPREFFTALYFRDPNRLLFELVTNTGLILPTAYENQSNRFKDVPLYLPTFLEPDRVLIEKKLHAQIV